MLHFRPLVFGLTLPVMNRLCIIVIILASNVMASSWLDLRQRNNPTEISNDIRSLATMTAVPRGNILHEFGQIGITQAMLSTSSGFAWQNQNVAFAIQPLPEWVFSAQLWNLPAQNPVFGYAFGGNYIWSLDNRVEWSSEIQLSQLIGQGTFNQKNLSLTQHYLRIHPSWFSDVALTYNLEHTLYHDIPGLVNQDRNYWIVSGSVGRTIFSSVQLVLNFSAQAASQATSLSLRWGVGN